MDIGPDYPSVIRNPLQLTRPFDSDWMGNIHVEHEGDKVLLLVPNDKTLLTLIWDFVEDMLSEVYTRITSSGLESEGLFCVKPYYQGSRKVRFYTTTSDTHNTLSLFVGRLHSYKKGVGLDDCCFASCVWYTERVNISSRPTSVD